MVQGAVFSRISVTHNTDTLGRPTGTDITDYLKLIKISVKLKVGQVCPTQLQDFSEHLVPDACHADAADET